MSAVDDNVLAAYLVMLLAYLPGLGTMAVMGLWALLRLHQRPWAGWIVLGIVVLSLFQMGSFWALSLLMAQISPMLGASGYQIAHITMQATNCLLEVATWWLMVLGLFGANPFQIGAVATSDDESLLY